LTLAVANAKSHPISAGGRHETAIAFLTDLEEKLEVAQVQLEVYYKLLPHADDAPEVGEKVKLLSERLFTMTEVGILRLVHDYITHKRHRSIKISRCRSICLRSSCSAFTYLSIATRV